MLGHFFPLEFTVSLQQIKIKKECVRCETVLSDMMESIEFVFVEVAIIMKQNNSKSITKNMSFIVFIYSLLHSCTKTHPLRKKSSTYVYAYT